MIPASLLSDFIRQFEDLKNVVKISERRVVSEPPDTLFFDNQNVFIKSYLVSACSILEAYIKDLAIVCTSVLQSKVNNLNLPYNFVTWIAEHEKAKLKYARFEGSKTSKDIEEIISPNYYKTVMAFQRIGVDVSSDAVKSFKDSISSTVDKRNKIVHHNDSASDISFKDIIHVIDNFILYVECLHREISCNNHLQ